MFIISRFKADMLQMKVHVLHFQSMHWTATQPLTHALPSMPCSESPKPSVIAISVPGRKISMAPALALPLPSPLMRRLTHPMATPPSMHCRPNKPSKRARENPARTSPCSPARPPRSWPRTKPTSPKSKRRTWPACTASRQPTTTIANWTRPSRAYIT